MAGRSNSMVSDRKTWLFRLAFTMTMLFALSIISSSATIQPLPHSIEEMAKDSYVIKAKVLSVESLADDSRKKLAKQWFVKETGYGPSSVLRICQAKLLIVSCLNGGLSAGDKMNFIFRSDSEIPVEEFKEWKDAQKSKKPLLMGWTGGAIYAHFDLVPGKTYYLFARNTPFQKTLKQYSSEMVARSSEGFYRALNDRPAPRKDHLSDFKLIKNVIVDDLKLQLSSGNKEAMTYAAETLKELEEDYNKLRQMQ